MRDEARQNWLPRRVLSLELLEDRTLPAPTLLPGLLVSGGQLSEPLADLRRSIAFAPRNFDPTRNLFPSSDQLINDLRLLHEAGWQTLVTYSLDGPLAEVPRLAREVGFGTVIAGVYWYDDAQLAREKVAAIDNARNGYIDGLVVGIEGLHEGRYSRADLERELSFFRETTGLSATTVEPAYMYLADPTLAELGDFSSPTIHPFWAGIRDPEVAVDFVVEQYGMIQQLSPGRTVIAFETWFPSGGVEGASETNQTAFFQGMLAMGIPFIPGEAFDQEWKSTTEGSQGPHWGLYTTTGTPKGATELFVAPGRAEHDTAFNGAERVPAEESLRPDRLTPIPEAVTAGTGPGDDHEPGSTRGEGTPNPRGSGGSALASAVMDRPHSAATVAGLLEGDVRAESESAPMVKVAGVPQQALEQESAAGGQQAADTTATDTADEVSPSRGETMTVIVAKDRSALADLVPASLVDRSRQQSMTTPANYSNANCSNPQMLKKLSQYPAGGQPGAFLGLLASTEIVSKRAAALGDPLSLAAPRNATLGSADGPRVPEVVITSPAYASTTSYSVVFTHPDLSLLLVRDNVDCGRTGLFHVPSAGLGHILQNDNRGITSLERATFVLDYAAWPYNLVLDSRETETAECPRGTRKHKRRKGNGKGYVVGAGVAPAAVDLVFAEWWRSTPQSEIFFAGAVVASRSRRKLATAAHRRGNRRIRNRRLNSNRGRLVTVPEVG